MSLADDMRYKGWSNFETYDLYLWLCNDDKTTLCKLPCEDIGLYSINIPTSPDAMKETVYGVFEKLQERYFVEDDIAAIGEADYQELAAAFRDKQA